MRRRAPLNTCLNACGAMPPNDYHRLRGVLTCLVRGDDPTALLKDSDCASLAGAAVRHRCAALLCAGLTQYDSQLPELRRALRVHEVKTTLVSAQLRAQLKAAVAALNRAGIVPVLLKGGARIWQSTPGYHLHPSVDLDVMVCPSQFQEALRVLHAFGYAEHTDGDTLRYYSRAHHHHAPLYVQGGVPIELHRELYRPGTLSTDTRYDAMLPYAREVSTGAGTARVFDVVGSALHLIVHAFGRPPLRDTYLLATLLRSMSQTDRAQLASIIENERLEPVRLAAVAYDAACMAAVPWRADIHTRRFTQWMLDRHSLSPRLYARADCADAVLARPQDPLRAFAVAAWGRPLIAERGIHGVLRHPVRVVMRAFAGIESLARISAWSPRPALHVRVRAALRRQEPVRRAGVALRAALRTVFPGALPGQAADLAARYPALGAFAHDARRARKRYAAFVRLARSPFITDYINGELARVAAAENALGRVMEYRRSITIVQTADFALKLRFIDELAQDSEIRTLLRSTLISPVGAGVTVQRYRLPKAVREGSFERAATLSKRDTVCVAPGEVLDCDARTDTYTTDQNGRGLLVLEYGAVQPLCWRFDHSKLTCNGAVSSDINASRLRETLELASALGVTDVVTPARSLLGHPSHVVRWSALAVLADFGGPAAVRMLRKAVRDPHPQLRRAAHRLLRERSDQWR